MRILYVGSGREKSYRTVEPLKLLYKSRAWYLKAYCLEKEAFRLFKLNRILKWEVLEENFTQRRVAAVSRSVFVVGLAMLNLPSSISFIIQ